MIASMPTIHRAVLFVAISFLCLAAAPTTNPSSSALIGRWKAISSGQKKIPAAMAIVWEFTSSSVITSINGETATKATYTTRQENGRNIIEMTYPDDKKPSRIGLYELKGDELKICVATNTGKPPSDWKAESTLTFQLVK